MFEKNVLSLAIGPEENPWVIEISGEIFVSTFFVRDETRDVLVAATAQKIIDQKACLPALDHWEGPLARRYLPFQRI